MVHNAGLCAQNDKRRFRAGFMGLIAGVCAWIWWFLLYPELCFPEDVYEVVYDEDIEDLGATGEEICHLLLQADREQVIVKSRLLELIRQHKD